MRREPPGPREAGATPQLASLLRGRGRSCPHAWGLWAGDSTPCLVNLLQWLGKVFCVRGTHDIRLCCAPVDFHLSSLRSGSLLRSAAQSSLLPARASPADGPHDRDRRHRDHTRRQGRRRRQEDDLGLSRRPLCQQSASLVGLGTRHGGGVRVIGTMTTLVARTATPPRGRPRPDFKPLGPRRRVGLAGEGSRRSWTGIVEAASLRVPFAVRTIDVLNARGRQAFGIRFCTVPSTSS